MNEYLGGPESRAGRIPTQYEQSVDAMREGWKPLPPSENSRPAATLAPITFAQRPPGFYVPDATAASEEEEVPGLVIVLLAALGVGYVFWENSSVMAGAVLGTIIVGGLLGAALLWPATRIWSSGLAPGRIVGAGFTSVFAYVATVYLLTRHGSLILNPVVRGLQHLLGASLDAQDPDKAFASLVLVSQAPALLVAAGTLSWRLKEAFGGVAGYLRACAVSLVMLLVLGGGTVLVIQQLLAHFNR
jgi:hypothetical protein